ncbi:unnamed protein product [Rhizoctonia solani]|uniref:F-box domain-containing protein n=1 Tax=Rhizoctonia solani TaxID=456999 RepID=A0A8H3D860_9AGAM|nr:unnamed protein product [Rhizoctonia solani]
MAEITQSPTHFDDLSDEIIVQVLHFCRYDEILRFASTNKRNYNILSNSVGLKLHVELDANGLDIIKGSRTEDGNYSRLLNELVRYRDAWLNLDLEEPTERTSNQVMSLWELREGHYVVAFSSTPALGWGPDSMQLTLLDSLETPDVITLPSVFHEFTPDFEQELVILVKTNPNDTACLEIRICSTTSGLPHPLARNPIFTVQVGFHIPGPGHQTFTLEVIDNILVARIADIMNYKYEIMAWDWKSGALLCRIGSSSGIADFALLDNAHLALLSVETDQEGPRSIVFSLYSLSTDWISTGSDFYASEYICARPILTFEFPKLDESYKVSSRVIMRSDPIPGRTIYRKSTSFTHSTALTFSIILSLLPIAAPEEDENSVHLRIFISATSLLPYLLKFANEEDTVVIPWNVWGAQATRWFLCDRQTSYWVYWTSGSRFVAVDENADSRSGLYDLSVFDFHPPTVRRYTPRDAQSYTELRSSLYKERMKEIVREGRGLTRPHPIISLLGADLAPLVTNTIDSDMPTVIGKGFSSPVESRLPYRVVTRPKFVPSCEDWSIDGDHIIGMNSVPRDFDRLTVYKLRT